MDHPLQKIRDAIKEDYLRIWKKLGIPPSRDEYNLRGVYNKEQINKYFGSFGAFKEYCGLWTAENFPKKIKSDIAKTSIKAEFKKRIEEEVMPYMGKYIRKAKDESHKLLVVAFDFHDEYTDPFTMKVFLDVIEERQPDYIAFGGDVVDFYELSHFSKDPARIFTLQRQIDFVKEKIFAPVRSVCPNSQIDYLLGNHEYRLIKFLMTEGQAVASLKCLEFGNLMELDKYNINLVATHPLDRIDDETHRNFKIYEGIYLVTHGTSTSKNPAHRELDKWRMSGCSGHVHHRQRVAQLASVVQSKVSAQGEMDWTSCGCMCKKLAGKDYIQDIIRWQNGFNIVHLFPDSGTHISEYVEVKNGIAVIGGNHTVCRNDEDIKIKN